MGLCRKLQKRGVFELLEDKIQLPRCSKFYKNSKIYRLLKFIQEATRLLVVHNGLIVKGLIVNGNISTKPMVH